ncbi:spore gernimation protein KA [Bacillus sp. HMF5848]|uniref:spore germination protein GerPB n=1 Tax=Bacillus sp. HMF5848 TaxID=2495421 RepID=UPI000F7A5EAC|nr:spore germination protein GerPB [Bacillus sp. HMF5848]RSK26364.1 spore gernimation protein KA [Bacillus sp. HMF5848]
MNYYISQNISIHNFKVGGISNSSVLQIGSAGVIKPLSNLYNTGQFAGGAPEADIPGVAEGPIRPRPLVPLSLS